MSSSVGAEGTLPHNPLGEQRREPVWETLASLMNSAICNINSGGSKGLRKVSKRPCKLHRPGTHRDPCGEDLRIDLDQGDLVGVCGKTTSIVSKV